MLKIPYDATSTPSLELPTLDFKFKTPTHVFYKNPRFVVPSSVACSFSVDIVVMCMVASCLELDEVIGDVQGIINDIEAALCRELELKESYAVRTISCMCYRRLMLSNFFR